MQEKQLTDEQKVKVLMAHRALLMAAGTFDQLIGNLKSELGLPSNWVLDVGELVFIRPQPQTGLMQQKVNGHAATQAQSVEES